MYEKLSGWIRNALFLKRVIPAFLLLLTGAYFYGSEMLEKEHLLLQSQETLFVKLGVSTLSQNMEAVTNDVMFLANSSILIDAVNHPTRENRVRLENDLVNFSRNKKIYDQIRWLDETGKEQVRINYQQGQPQSVALDKLQNKGGRYYFSDTFKLKSGEIFISQLDLNVENGNVEIPFKPVIRIGTPIVDRQGVKRGIMLVNYYAANMLEAFAVATAHYKNHISVLNNDGFWLKSPTSSDEWGFMFNKKDLTLPHRAPNVWKEVQGGVEGNTYDTSGLWVWGTVYPLLNRTRSSMGVSELLPPDSSESEAREYFWKVVAYQDQGTIRGLLIGVWSQVLSIAALLFALVCLGSWRLARAEGDVRRINAELEQLVSKRTSQLDDKVVELRKSRQQLSLALEAANIGLWDWRPLSGELYTNDIFHTMLGHTPDSFPETLERWSSLVHPDDLEPVMAMLQPFLDSDDTFYRSEYRMRTADGQWKWIMDVGRVVQRNDQGRAERFIGIHVDTTVHKQDELLLQESQNKFQRLVDDMGNKFVVFSHRGLTGEILYVSDGVSSVFGLTKEEVMNQSWGASANWLPESAEAAQSYAIQQVEGKAGFLQFEMCFIHPDGEERTIRVASHPVIDVDGNVLSIDGILEDYTEQKKIEQQLIKAQQHAEAANESKSMFLANMSHEIRTPMNSIIGRTNLALADEPDGELRAHLEMISSSSENLLALINDILDLSKIEAGEVEIENRPFDLHELIHSCRKTIGSLIGDKEKQLELTCTIASEVPQAVTGDALRLRQVLLNLLSNAVKFTEKGYVDLSVERLKSDDELLRFQFNVRDTGRGIAFDKQEHIFSKFAQEDSSTTRKYGGTGLGLAICWQLCQLMEGSIQVLSTPGKGAAFIVTLPFQPCSVEAFPPAEKTVPREQSEGRPLSLLLVEDNDPNRILARMVLEKKNHQVTEAHDGLQALNLLGKQNFDAILMDVQMPVMDGLAASRIIRAAECGGQIEGIQEDLAMQLTTRLSGSHTQIIAMTANAMSGDREECMAAGMDDYLSKPLRIDDLYEKLTKLMAS